MKCEVLVAQSCLTLWTVAHQAPLSMEFPRQEYWRGLPCPPPGDLPDPGIKFWLPALQADSLLSEPPGKSWRAREAGYMQLYHLCWACGTRTSQQGGLVCPEMRTGHVPFGSGSDEKGTQSSSGLRPAH